MSEGIVDLGSSTGSGAPPYWICNNRKKCNKLKPVHKVVIPAVGESKEKEQKKKVREELTERQSLEQSSPPLIINSPSSGP